jgi:hypothetical protein
MKPGDVVKLKLSVPVHSYMKRHSQVQATIVAMLEDIPGGVFLDGHLAGFRYWNVEELELVRTSEDNS